MKRNLNWGILLEDRDTTLVQLYQWVDLAFAKACRELIEGGSKRARVLEVLNGARLEINLHANDIAYLNKVTASHILAKLFSVRTELTVEKIKDPIVFLLIVHYSSFIQIKVFSAESQAHLDASSGSRCRQRARGSVNLIEICLNSELEIIAIT